MPGSLGVAAAVMAAVARHAHSPEERAFVDAHFRLLRDLDHGKLEPGQVRAEVHRLAEPVFGSKFRKALSDFCAGTLFDCQKMVFADWVGQSPLSRAQDEQRFWEISNCYPVLHHERDRMFDAFGQLRIIRGGYPEAGALKRHAGLRAAFEHQFDRENKYWHFSWHADLAGACGKEVL